MVIGLAQDNKLWTFQVKQVISLMKTASCIDKVVPYLMMSIGDRLLLQTVFENVKKESLDSNLI